MINPDSPTSVDFAPSKAPQFNSVGQNRDLRTSLDISQDLTSFPDQLLSASKGGAIMRNMTGSFKRFYNVVQRIPIFRKILAILESLYRFIKYDIFFLFNDEEEELKESYRDQIEEFEDVFQREFGPNTDEGREAIRNRYFKLEPDAQKMIKEEVLKILKLDRPDLAKDEIQSRRDELLKDPFKVFDGLDEDDPKSYVMPRAINSALRQL